MFIIQEKIYKVYTLYMYLKTQLLYIYINLIICYFVYLIRKVSIYNIHSLNKCFIITIIFWKKYIQLLSTARNINKFLPFLQKREPFSGVVYSHLAIRINRLLVKYLSLLTFMEHTHLRFYYRSFWKLRLLQTLTKCAWNFFLRPTRSGSPVQFHNTLIMNCP